MKKTWVNTIIHSFSFWQAEIYLIHLHTTIAILEFHARAWLHTTWLNATNQNVLRTVNRVFMKTIRKCQPSGFTDLKRVTPSPTRAYK